LAAGLAACGAAADAAPARRVFLITCDTLRADCLGLYGDPRGASPRLDALGERGAVFEEAYATAPMTQPSVSSLMTGRLPEHIGVARGNLRLLPPEVETLAERLAAEGVATAAVVSNSVLRREEGSPDEDHGVAQGFGHYDDRMEEQEANREAFERRAAGTTDAAIAWLEAADLERSLFLWVHYQDPHGPYTPPPELSREFATDPGGEAPLAAGTTNLGAGQIPSYQLLGAERRPSVYRDRYFAEIRHFDAELGRFLDWLGARGLLASSYVLFTADHGESLGEHDYWFCHGENVHREVVRVPLVVCAPEGARGPRGRVEAVVSLVDVFPTVLEVFGLEPGAVAGRSLLSPPQGERVVGQSLVPRSGRERWWGVSDGRYRAIWSERHPEPRLFDVRADPGEERDLAGTDPERARRMIAAWNEVLAAGAEGAVGLGRALDEGGSAERLEVLQRLGYVEGAEDEDDEGAEDGDD
jgi:arylsulfatase